MKRQKPDPRKKEGGCICGAVRFQTKLNGLHYHVCHCERCRKWGGPAFGAPASIVEFEGEEALSIFSSSRHGERLFCGQCGTHLLWRLKSGGTYVIWIGALDQSDDLQFENEMFIDAKPDHYSFANSSCKLTSAEIKALFAQCESAG